MASIDALHRAAQNLPDQIARISEVRTLTYGELGKRSDALAAHFTERFPGDKSPVAIIGHKEPEMLVGFLAAVKSGRPYVPIDVSIPRGVQNGSFKAPGRWPPSLHRKFRPFPGSRGLGGR